MADLLAYGEDIIGFPGGEATAKVKLMKLLWENPDPSAEFAAQTITLSSDDYDILMCVTIMSTSSQTYTQASFASKDKNGMTLDLAAASNGDLWTRFIARTSDTVLSVGGCSKWNNGSSSISNDLLIPYQIYGIKLEQEIPVVAENVSTLAANCLLSDGESVGERVEANTFGTYVDIASYTSKNSPYECPSDGYVRVSTGTTSASTQAVVREAITDITLIAARPNGIFGAEGIVFVKKGMKVYVLVNTASAGIYFIPIT